MPSAEEVKVEDEPGGKQKKKKQKNKYKIQHEEVSSTTPDSQSSKGWSFSTHQSSYNPRTYLLVKPGMEELEEEEVCDSHQFWKSQLHHSFSEVNTVKQEINEAQVFSWQWLYFFSR